MTFLRVLLPAVFMVIIQLTPQYTGLDKEALTVGIITAIALAAQAIVTAINDAVTAMRAIAVAEVIAKIQALQRNEHHDR